VRESLDAVASIDGQALHGRGALHLPDEPARDVGALLEHGALDAGDEGHGQPSRRAFALLDEEVGLALDREDGRDSEAHDEHDHDEDGDLGGEGGGGELHACTASRSSLSRPACQDRMAQIRSARPAQYGSRSTRLRSLPAASRGKSWWKETSRGTL